MNDRDYFNREYFELHEGKKGYLDFLANLIKSKVKEGKVLDIGCGYGFFLEALDKNGYETYGFDASEIAIAEAKKRTNAKLEILSGDSPFPYQDNYFNCITMFDVIEHINNFQQALQESYRALKSGGVLFIITLNSDSILKKMLNKKWSWYQDPTHIHMFSEGMLVKSLQRVRFKEIETKTCFNFYVAGETTKAFRILRKLRGITFMPKYGDSLLAIGRK